MKTDNFYTAVSENGFVVLYGINSTDIVREAEQLHKTSAVCTAALGRLLTAAAIMTNGLKNAEHSITLRMKGDGPAGLLVAIAQGNGTVRGYVENRWIDLPARPDGKLDVGGAVGHTGQLSVVKDLGLREPYCGLVPIVSGEIAEDITSYFATSEQIPTVCSLGVLVNADLSVHCAGGFLLQLLPGYSEADIQAVERNIKDLPSITTMLKEDPDIVSVMNRVMDGFQPHFINNSCVAYQCNCSEERTLRMLRCLKKDQLEEMIAEDPKVEVVCEFCGKHYHYDLRELENYKF